MAVGTSAGELREFSDEELTDKLREFKEELFNLRFQSATNSSQFFVEVGIGGHAAPQSPATVRRRPPRAMEEKANGARRS